MKSEINFFRELLITNTNSKTCSGNTISDGRYECSLQTLPTIFSRIDEMCPNFDELLPECYSVPVGCCVPDVIVLLWLLYNNKSFFIFPHINNNLSSENSAILSGFCTNEILIERNINKEIDLLNPETYIQFNKHKEYDESVGSLFKGKVLMKTSGSTSFPKLVVHSSQKIFQNALNCTKRLSVNSKDRILIPVPIYHMYGLGAALLTGILTGASINLMGSTNIIKYIERERTFNPNIAFLTPHLCQMMLSTRKSPRQYKLVMIGGDKINKETFYDFETKFGKLINLYGSTELGVIAASDINETLTLRSEGVVRTVAGVKINFKKISTQNPTEVYHILCKHKNGFEYYVDNYGKKLETEADNNSEVFDTKDVGIMLSKDCFRVIDRRDNCINRTGLLVSFSEVETLMIDNIKEISQAFVFTDHSETERGKKLISICELKQKTLINANDIRALCFQAMKRHLVPDDIYIVDQIPKLQNGKTDRQKLIAIYNENKIQSNLNPIIE